MTFRRVRDVVTSIVVTDVSSIVVTDGDSRHRRSTRVMMINTQDDDD